MRLDPRGEPEARDEADHDARQGGHDLDRRLDLGLDRGVHELRGVEGPEDGEGDREGERVEGGLDRAEDQGDEAHLRLEVVGGAGRLPHPLRLRVALVPDLSEDRPPRELRVRVQERVPLEVVRALDEDAVGAGRDHDGVRRPAFAREPQERPLRGEVADHDRAVGAPGGEAPLAARGADREDGGSLPLEVVGLHHRGLGLGARAGPEPAGEVPVPVADDHGVAAEAELHRGQGSGAHLRDVGEPGLGPSDVPVVELSPLGAGHERGPPEADVGDLLPVAGAQRLEGRLGGRLPLRGLAHPGERRPRRRRRGRRRASRPRRTPGRRPRGPASSPGRSR